METNYGTLPMKNSWIVLLTLCTGLLFGASQSHAALIAHYTFDGGSLQNFANPGTHDLSAFGAAPTFSGDSYVSDGNAANFLQAAGLGTTTTYTISMWVNPLGNPGQAPQGAFFSTTDNPVTVGGWQLEAHSGWFNFRRRDDANATGSIALGTVAGNTWQHIAIQQSGTGAGLLDLYLNGTLVTSVHSASALDLFRVGINRSDARSFDGLIDNIRIYDDANQDIAALFDEGHDVSGNGNGNEIPSPATISLLGAGLLGLAAIRRRRQS